MLLNGLFSSWATPAASVPIAASFLLCSSSFSRARSCSSMVLKVRISVSTSSDLPAPAAMGRGAKCPVPVRSTTAVSRRRRRTTLPVMKKRVPKPTTMNRGKTTRMAVRETAMDFSTRARASLSIASVAPRMLSPLLRSAAMRASSSRSTAVKRRPRAARATPGVPHAHERLVEEVGLDQAAHARVGGVALESGGLPLRLGEQRRDAAEVLAIQRRAGCAAPPPGPSGRRDALDDLVEVGEGLVDGGGFPLLVGDGEQEVLLVPAQLQRAAPDGVGQFEEDRLVLDLDEVQVEECREKRDNEGAEEKAQHDLLLERHGTIVAPEPAAGRRAAAARGRSGWRCLGVTGAEGRRAHRSTGPVCCRSCAGAI